MGLEKLRVQLRERCGLGFEGQNATVSDLASCDQVLRETLDKIINCETNQ